MAETVYTTSRAFSTIHGERVVSVDAGSGQVVVECEHGPGNWITMKTYSADAVELVNFGFGRSYRFTVSGGATYAI